MELSANSVKVRLVRCFVLAQHRAWLRCAGAVPFRRQQETPDIARADAFLSGRDPCLCRSHVLGACENGDPRPARERGRRTLRRGGCANCPPRTRSSANWRTFAASACRRPVSQAGRSQALPQLDDQITLPARGNGSKVTRTRVYRPWNSMRSIRRGVRCWRSRRVSCGGRAV